MDVRICGIYSVTHIDSGRRYIGKSCNIKVRWNEHVRDCRNYNNRFYNALKKYGRESFKWEIVEECARDILNDREKYWITYFDTTKTGFNLTPGGDGLPPGFKHSAEERAAKSARQKGRPHTSEHNRKVAEALTGRVPTEAELFGRRRAADSLRGRKRTISEEALVNMRAAGALRKGCKQSPESMKKQWETRRAKYGSTGLSPDGLAVVSARASTLVLSRWTTK